MAVMRNGIFSNPSGKTGGVVFARWKDVDYVRAYTVPANPQTVSQTTQRNKMKKAVAFIKPLIYTVLNKFYDPFEKSRSAFNTFISKNLTLFTASPTWGSVVLGEGSLFAPANGAGVTYVSGTKTLTRLFATDTGYNGLSTDLVTICVYNETKNSYHYQLVPVQRSTGTVTCVITGGATGDLVKIWIWAYTEVNSVVTSVSTTVTSAFVLTA